MFRFSWLFVVAFIIFSTKELASAQGLLPNDGLSGYEYVAVTPCRIADTRNAPGTFGGPIMAADSTRSFPIPISSCSIPSTAVAYSLNVTVVPTAVLSYLTVWPSDQPKPFTSTLNSDGRVKANATIVAAAATDGGISVYASNATHVIIDINGYFTEAEALAFYPLPPCRVVDTRQPTAPLGGPLIGPGLSRSFPLLSSTCGIPSTAQAYALNFTALPRGVLNFLTTWATGQGQPPVSTLNAPTGAATANAAIVPAGINGAITVFATDSTDVLIDVNGYFAPVSSGGLSLHTLSTPCRVVDTRLPPDAPPFSGTIEVNVAQSGCSLGLLFAQAFLLNATLVPSVGPVGWLTIWPHGAAQPGVSTLNAYDGTVTSNLAIVPTSDGSINAFAPSQTYLIVDVSGYFAP